MADGTRRHAAPAADQDTGQVTSVGLVCEPHGEPVGIARRLAEELRERLAGREEGAYEVRVHHERLAVTEDTGNAELLKHLGDLGRRNGWDLTLCIVDVPMSADGRAIVADAHLGGGAALLSLPAFGAMHHGRRVREVAEFITREHSRPPPPGGQNLSGDDAAGPGKPFERVEPRADGIDLRILASRGRWRLLVGMVRANRPWRLVLGLTGALAAALATGAYVLVNATTWKLALHLGGLKLSAAALFAVAAMVAWLILDHKLWTPAASSRRAGLYNGSTVLTLLIGVLCMYAGVFAILLVASTFTMDPGFFRSEIGRALVFGDYLTITFMASSMAIVAGALGSGFESEDAVRQAAYSYRERERRAAVDDQAKDERDRSS